MTLRCCCSSNSNTNAVLRGLLCCCCWPGAEVWCCFVTLLELFSFAWHSARRVLSGYNLSVTRAV